MTADIAHQARTRPKRHSPTSLKAFESCPKQYEFTYVEKVRAEEAPSAELVFGNALHQALAFLHRLPVAERSVGAAHQALRHFWAQTERDGAFLGESEEIVWGKRALAVLEQYCGQQDLEGQPLAIERWVRALLPSGAVLSGKADRVDALPDSEGVEVIDYKTGRCRIRDDAELREDLGAKVYALAATRTLRRPVRSVRFLFIAEGVERQWQLEAEDLASIETDLDELTMRVEATEEFEPVTGRHCDWCPFFERCPAQGGAALADLGEGDGVAF